MSERIYNNILRRQLDTSLRQLKFSIADLHRANAVMASTVAQVKLRYPTIVSPK